MLNDQAMAKKNRVREAKIRRTARKAEKREQMLKKFAAEDAAALKKQAAEEAKKE